MKTKLLWIIAGGVVSAIVIYGFYEKYEHEALYKDFRAGRSLQCGDTIVQKNSGWKIKNNRFFSNGETIKTIVFCKRVK